MSPPVIETELPVPLFPPPMPAAVQPPVAVTVPDVIFTTAFVLSSPPPMPAANLPPVAATTPPDISIEPPEPPRLDPMPAP